LGFIGLFSLLDSGGIDVRKIIMVTLPKIAGWAMESFGIGGHFYCQILAAPCSVLCGCIATHVASIATDVAPAVKIAANAETNSTPASFGNQYMV
jgi:hypothetical protein